MLLRILPLLLLFYSTMSQADSFRFDDDADHGRLTLREGDKPVLTYNYGEQLADGVDKKYARCSYIHPLYNLDGSVMTADFPKDHRHHHGVFWAWPQMKARGREVQLWLPDVLRNKFDRWIERKADENGATLTVENDWVLDGKEKVGHERVAISVFPATDVGRAIDITLTVQAIGGPIELFGPRYGGMNVRLVPEKKTGPWTTSAGVVRGDQMNKPFQWVDLSSDGGLAVMVPPRHPDSPIKWLLRSSYGAVICAHWPSDSPYTLKPDHPVTLPYRLYVHRGDAEAGQVLSAYKAYAAKTSK